MVGLQLHKKNLAALWMGLWLELDLQQKTRWLCSRRLLAGGTFVRLEGRRMLSCWLRELFLTPPGTSRAPFCQNTPVACGTFTKSWREKLNVSSLLRFYNFIFSFIWSLILLSLLKKVIAIVQIKLNTQSLEWQRLKISTCYRCYITSANCLKCITA